MKTANDDQGPRNLVTMVTENEAAEQTLDRDKADMIRMGKAQQTRVSVLLYRPRFY